MGPPSALAFSRASSLTLSKFFAATVAEMSRRKRRSSGHPGTWKVVYTHVPVSPWMQVR